MSKLYLNDKSHKIHLTVLGTLFGSFIASNVNGL